MERFTKRQQKVPAAEPHIERLLKEESYLQSRLAFVQQVRSRYPPLLKPPVLEEFAHRTPGTRRAKRGSYRRGGARSAAQGGLCRGLEHLMLVLNATRAGAERRQPCLAARRVRTRHELYDPVARRTFASLRKPPHVHLLGIVLLIRFTVNSPHGSRH